MSDLLPDKGITTGHLFLEHNVPRQNTHKNNNQIINGITKVHLIDPNMQLKQDKSSDIEQQPLLGDRK